MTAEKQNENYHPSNCPFSARFKAADCPDTQLIYKYNYG